MAENLDKLGSKIDKNLRRMKESPEDIQFHLKDKTYNLSTTKNKVSVLTTIVSREKIRINNINKKIMPIGSSIQEID